jgi:hypothetical protein
MQRNVLWSEKKNKFSKKKTIFDLILLFHFYFVYFTACRKPSSIFFILFCVCLLIAKHASKNIIASHHLILLPPQPTFKKRSLAWAQNFICALQMIIQMCIHYGVLPANWKQQKNWRWYHVLIFFVCFALCL